MSVWQEAKAGDGRVYYWNTQTKQTRWDKPEDFDSVPATPATPSADPATIDASWREAKANGGKPYYYNTITKETRWEPPEAFLKQQQNTAPTGPSFVAGSRPGFGGGDDFDAPPRDRRMGRRDDRDHSLPQKPSFDDRRGGGGMPWERPQENSGFRGPMPAKADEPEYSNPEQAEDAFFKLLKRNNVTPDTAWEDALRLVIKDKEYRALKDPKERRQAFEKYCLEVRAQEKGKEKERRERLREEFRQMLKTHDEIKQYTRWKTARPMIEREAVFKQADDEDERRSLFEEYIVELKRRHAEEEREKHTLAMQELHGLLQAMIVDADTKWSEAQEAITKNERFSSNDLFRSLNTVDLLSAFDSHMRDLDRARHEAKQKDRRLHTRRERKIREAYRAMLAQHLNEGHIKAGTKWKDFHPLIKDDERYHALLGNPGSGALDMFWDVVEDEERKLRTKRNTALDVLEEQRWEMKTSHTLQDFVATVGNDPRMSNVSSDEMQLIFDRLMEKVIRRAEDDKAHAERAQRKAVDALRSAIKHLEPPVRLGDTWEEVRVRIEREPEFADVEDEEARKSAFEKHMKRLKEKEEDIERERARRAERDARNGSRRERDDRDRRHRTRTPEIDAYEADRRRAQEARERSYRKASFGLTPPPRDRRDDRAYDDRRRLDRAESIYDRERREREMERERNYVSRADPRDKGRTLDYGDEDAVGSRPGSVRKRRESENSNATARDKKRPKRDAEAEHLLKEEPPALQSGSEEGEIEEV
ncbi:hypothetical protein NU219Hw_g4343t1 [Hortaea werneckii]